jgi:hypothetical protein
VDAEHDDDAADEGHPIGVIPVGHPLPDKRSPSRERGWIPFEDFAR